MSLKDPDDEYDELVPNKKRLFKLPNWKKTALLLGAGILLGIIIQLILINPIIYSPQSSGCTECLFTKEMLNTENDCLYSLLENPKSASEQCATKKYFPAEPIISTHPLEETD